MDCAAFAYTAVTKSSCSFSMVMTSLDVYKRQVLGYNFGVSTVGVVLIGLISFLTAAVCITFMVLGIVNVARGKDQYLPIIGRFAFYK